MRNVPLRARATSAFPSSIPRSKIAETRHAVTAAHERLVEGTPVASLSLGALRKRVITEHERYVARGGKDGLPNVEALSRAELEDILRKLKGVARL